MPYTIYGNQIQLLGFLHLFINTSRNIQIIEILLNKKRS